MGHMNQKPRHTANDFFTPNQDTQHYLLRFSLAIAAVLGGFYAYLATFFFDERVGMIIEVPSRYGNGRVDYVEMATVLAFSALFFIAALVVAGIAYLAGRQKAYTLQGMTVLLFESAVSIYLAIMVGNVVEELFNNTVLTIVSVLLVFGVLALGIGVYLSKLQKSRRQ